MAGYKDEYHMRILQMPFLWNWVVLSWALLGIFLYVPSPNHDHDWTTTPIKPCSVFNQSRITRQVVAVQMSVSWSSFHLHFTYLFYSFFPFSSFFFLLSLLFPKCLRLLKTADFLKYLLSNEQANKSYMGLEGGFPPFHGVQVKQLLKTLVEELCLSVEPSAGGALLTRGRQRDLLCTGEALSFA